MVAMVRKRDGRKVPFDPEKIVAAIGKAGAATGEFDERTARRLACRTQETLFRTVTGECADVEAIQDIVEATLLDSPFRRTARAYIVYREQHARLREIAARAGTDIVDQYLERADWRVNENSNMAFSLQGLNNYISSEISRVYWLNRIYPPEIREAHVGGDFHLHDLNILSVYCVGWDLRDLLVEGFRGVPGKVASKPARHFRTALGQAVNFFYTLQGEAAGAQAFANFDTLLAPFIRFDRLRYPEVLQAMQEFVFNINVPTRVGFQTPFTNITLDLAVPAGLADQPVIIGGVPRRETYREFKPEMDMMNRAFLEVMLAGDANGRVFTFPIPTYNITRGFPWDDPALELLWKVTGRYGIPYFCNFVNSDLDPEDARSMCCRLRLDTRTLRRRGGGLFGANPLTGSIGVVTLNMPRLGRLARDEADFFRRLERLMLLARESLEIKRKVLENLTARDLYPYASFYLRQVKKNLGEYWKNHFSTVGLLGMNECCLNLFGQGLGEPRGRLFTLKTLDFMRAKLLAFQAETGNDYNLEATPAEGAGYRLARADREKFPGIITAGGNGEPFYTNSTQLPVDFTDDPFEALALQDEIQARYTGGTVLHFFLGEEITDPGLVRKTVRRICEENRLPYFTLAPTFSVCAGHGYLAGRRERCPRCGAACEIYSRVVGYLRPVAQWNRGKQAEFGARRGFRFEMPGG